MVVTNYPVVAPMLDSLSLYSNYWSGMGVDYYYRRTDEYVPIREREKKGCYRVMLVHSAFLIDLRQAESLKLTFKPENIKGYEGPTDDIIILAIAAFWSGNVAFVFYSLKNRVCPPVIFVLLGSGRQVLLIRSSTIVRKIQLD